jgi:vacuolar-type H+-ATPase subunit I/STV1
MLRGLERMPNRSRADIFEALFEQVDEVAKEVEENKALIAEIKTLLKAVPNEERLGALRSELKSEIEAAERRTSEAVRDSRVMSEEKRAQDRVSIEDHIAKVAKKEQERGDTLFPDRLKANLPQVLDTLADERRERMKRRLGQITPWLALLIMCGAFLAQCVGVNGAGLQMLGQGIARVK